MQDISRRFPVILDFRSGAGHVGKYLDGDLTDRVIQCDTSEAQLFRDASANIPGPISFLWQRARVAYGFRLVPIERLLTSGDEDLPLPDDSVDAAVSCLSLHWINNLPKALSNICRVLKPDAPFVGAMLGGQTLFELR